MVKLYEYQGKQILKKHAILVPEGFIVSRTDSIQEIIKMINERIGTGRGIVIKAQVLTTGRLKAGGIKFASNINEAISMIFEMFNRKIKGMKVEKILVEEKLEINREFYVSITVSDSYKIKGPILIFSVEGGIDIEEIAEKYPERILMLPIDYIKGINRKDLEKSLLTLNLPANITRDIIDIIAKLYDIFKKYDAHTVEVNPLVLTKDGRVVAADCRIIIDDNSVFRHPELGIEIPRDIARPFTDFEKIAWRIEENDYRGVSYFIQFVDDINEIARGGYIAFHGIGGGAAMLASEALLRKGFKLATYLDTSGNPTAFKVYRAMKVALSLPGIEGYFLAGAVIANQEQWYHGFAIVKVLREYAKYKSGFPVLILIAGNKEAETHKIIREGLSEIPIRWELYGREKVLDIDYLADRFSKLIEDYKQDKTRTTGDINSFINIEKPSRDELKHHIWFKTSTGGEIYIDHRKCIAPKCGFLCVKACRWMGSGILKIKNGKPSLVSEDPTVVSRLCTECLACEYYCKLKEGDAIKIIVPIHGLEDVVKKYSHLYG
jgi:succinyl-CoA synthetase beta subunit